MRRTVILRHSRDGYPDHFDWMIDQPDLQIEHRLITFRVPVRPDQSPEFIAQKAPDHRAIYLEYEGGLSGDRGSVKRVAEGVVHQWESDGQSIRCRIDWGQGIETLSGFCDEGRCAFRRID
jgi:hypothetical protein